MIRRSHPVSLRGAGRSRSEWRTTGSRGGRGTLKRLAYAAAAGRVASAQPARRRSAVGRSRRAGVGWPRQYAVAVYVGVAGGEEAQKELRRPRFASHLGPRGVAQPGEQAVVAVRPAPFFSELLRHYHPEAEIP